MADLPTLIQDKASWFSAVFLQPKFNLTSENGVRNRLNPRNDALKFSDFTTILDELDKKRNSDKKLSREERAQLDTDIGEVLRTLVSRYDYTVVSTREPKEKAAQAYNELAKKHENLPYKELYDTKGLWSSEHSESNILAEKALREGSISRKDFEVLKKEVEHDLELAHSLLYRLQTLVK